MRSTALRIAGLAVAAGLVPAEAPAEEFQRIRGELSVELENDLTYDSDDPDSELNDLYSTIEADVSAFATEAIYVNTHLTLESVLDPDPGMDRTFEDMGFYADVITVNYETDMFHLYGGKFGPNFSIAYDAAPGLFGADFSEDDIELAERLGAGGSVSFGDEQIGMHAVSASVFFADTSILSESAFTNRGRVRETDGGPSNTESPESFTVAVDGGDFAALPGFRYHVGFAHQAVDLVLDDNGAPLGDIADEERIAVAGEWAIEVDEDVTVTPLLEYVRFWNAQGMADQDRNYLTAATQVDYRNWNVAVAYTGRLIDNQAAADVTDYQFQVSAGYAFDFGLEAGIGWKLVEEDDVQSQVIGVLLAYVLEF